MEKKVGFFKNIGGKIKSAWNESDTWSHARRCAIMAIPVVVIAVALALYNMVALPAAVSIGVPLFENGILVFKEYMVNKFLAVFIPLLITSVCLLMVFLSKRTSFPFIISLFSLILPIFFMIAAKLPG